MEAVGNEAPSDGNVGEGFSVMTLSAMELLVMKFPVREPPVMKLSRLVNGTVGDGPLVIGVFVMQL